MILFSVQDYILDGIISYRIAEKIFVETKRRAHSCGLHESGLDQERQRSRSRWDGFFEMEEGRGSWLTRRKDFLRIFGLLTRTRAFTKQRVFTGRVLGYFRNSLWESMKILTCYGSSYRTKQGSKYPALSTFSIFSMSKQVTYIMTT